MFDNVNNHLSRLINTLISKLYGLCNRGICSLYIFTAACTIEAWLIKASRYFKYADKELSI